MAKIEFSERLLKEIKNGLCQSHTRLAVAESVTAGFLQLACSQMENATAVFAGGITTYAMDEKIRILQVDAEEAKRCNCVSASITDQMAVAVAALFHADWGIATTGYATVVPESRGELFAFISVAHQGKLVDRKKIELQLPMDAVDAQYAYTIAALENMTDALRNR